MGRGAIRSSRGRYEIEKPRRRGVAVTVADLDVDAVVAGIIECLCMNDEVKGLPDSGGLVRGLDGHLCTLAWRWAYPPGARVLEIALTSRKIWAKASINYGQLIPNPFTDCTKEGRM